MNNSRLKLSILVAVWMAATLPLTAGKKPQDTLYSGYAKDLAGEVLAYHSCHPEANSSLLIRCLNATDYIEWLTAVTDASRNDDTLIFCWIGGFSTGTSTGTHTFRLSIEGVDRLLFTTRMGMLLSGWKIKGEKGVILDFRFASEDHVRDHFGYFFLKVPQKLVTAGQALKIRVQGDASGSRDWYMTMRYSIQPRMSLVPEEALIRGPRDSKFQRIKLSLDHFGTEEDIRFAYEGDSVQTGRLRFGVNDFILAVNPAVKRETRILKVISKSHTREVSFQLSPVRAYKVYLLPHSHVDIGYTALQEVVAERHARHVQAAMRLVKQSRNLPENARFRWNVEMLWEAEAFLQRASEEDKKEFISMVKNGEIELEGMYAGVMTGLCRDEELFHLFDYKKELEKKYGFTLPSAMITDIPGYVWGLVSPMAQSGIRYFSVGPNSGDRIGNTITAWGDKPFYWLSPSRCDSILFWMSSMGYALFHRGSLAKTDGSQVLGYLRDLSESNYPYDLVQLRYTILGDNGPPDSLLPAYVKAWNEKYVSPELCISTATRMFQEFEGKYGRQLPSLQGDFSPYWEDGAASSALETGMNRASAEKMVTGEKVYCMAAPGLYPEPDVREGWKQVVLYSEHTWGAWNSTSDPDLPEVKGQWQVKRGFAEAAQMISSSMTEKIRFRMVKDPKGKEVITVFNPSSWARQGMIYFPQSLMPPGNLSLFDDQGHECQVQKLENGMACSNISSVPSLGYRNFDFRPAKKPMASELVSTSGSLENNVLRVEWDSVTGNITSLWDKVRKKEWVDRNAAFGMNEYVYTGTDGVNPKKQGRSTIRLTNNGPLLCSVELASSAPGCITLVRKISLCSNDGSICILDKILKNPVREKENVRFTFPFSLKDPEVRMDMAGFVLEPGINQLTGANNNFYSVQRWIDVSDKTSGITMATPDALLWETGAMTGESWMTNGPEKQWLTQPLKSSLLFSWVMNNSWHTNFRADQDGEVSFRYVIRPHGIYDPVENYRFGTESSQPLVVMAGEVPEDGLHLPAWAGNSSVVVSALSMNQEVPKEVMYRLYNVTDKLLTFKPFAGNVPFRKCDPNGDITGERMEQITLKPYEIITVSVPLLPGN